MSSSQCGATGSGTNNMPHNPTSSETVTKIFHETVVNVKKFEYTWKIRNITHCGKEPGEPLESSVFCAGDDSSVRWKILLYTRGSYKEFKNSLSLHLVLVSSNRSAVYAKYKFALLDPEGVEYYVRSTPWAVLFKPGYWQGFEEYVERSKLCGSNLLGEDDTLVLRCTGGVVADWSVPVPPCQLRDNLGSLLDSQHFTDVSLRAADGRELRAHKAILAARSPVFAAMFDHDMVEGHGSSVNITDVEFDVLAAAVRYVYTGRVLDLEGAADCLLAVADKYELPGLKALCENELGSRLTADNAAGLLVLADRHGASALKERALGFIEAHLRRVIGTPGWKEVVLSHPNLVREVSDDSCANDINGY